ncbi:hypothetical protein M406DRAFT_358239 [Cryphonectria parasitica EP155]|uniref:Uncharacterized protein n=1 Tax=Cryphonectria parasitica (strain ATCC 38755 / EP155) TaxID=660469 RepID=A0A9P4XTP0_CRYP1|nr:uncharacterized protein M406DRAFT_358239 [Cryphonectria parasitica EP155]KAF3760585.1 hypothetical protein M406DRAFT_358239 [Cryphonectria parasitica EP155]
MTRVTPLPRELAKLTRSLGSSVAAPRSSQLLSNSSRAGAARVRKDLENGTVDMLPASERSMTTAHRPSPQPTPNPARTIPLMQSFHSTPTATARSDISTIDFAFLPSLADSSPSADSFAQVRVPLLPDNFAPERPPAIFAPELQGDVPLPRSEIIVMAADPASVSAVSALTEVEGMGPDGVELRFDFESRAPAEAEGEYAGGMLTDLWKGLVEDVLGGQKSRPAF